VKNFGLYGPFAEAGFVAGVVCPEWAGACSAVASVTPRPAAAAGVAPMIFSALRRVISIPDPRSLIPDP
jgi:hypothetical protein